MVEVGEKMLKHCNGHPLAIVEEFWQQREQWRNSKMFVTIFNPIYKAMDYIVLALSYYEFSYHLKASFVVLGYFPEDFEILLERLYYLWITKGITERGGKRSLEDIAKVYLNGLVHKGMVQVVSRDVMGNIKMCELHDLMRDKCLQITKDENFLLTIVYARNHELQQQHPSSCILDDRIRHLPVYVGDSVQELESIANSTKLPHLKSLLLFPSGKVSYYHSRGDIPQSLELLRILDFTGFSYVRLSSSIMTLIYLRYISLRSARITELPSEIGNLRSLLI
ncbi:LOW QUALITY PROTEIN: hypothetical protein Cgig2_024520 [Carnegiea gigantea]|uniref:Disease resistance protein winged helix domain-containing protein n=1 Tax=Carnegiea gigantea TaxID=171969 RepID=A0A9Q1JHA7_9CARY|nr:LOW QUALITY PROTEIN: hypothetical protein Cgig2_024520 [Carnegiea gigantea]